eukprot:Pgem_evm1s15539
MKFAFTFLAVTAATGQRTAPPLGPNDYPVKLENLEELHQLAPALRTAKYPNMYNSKLFNDSQIMRIEFNTTQTPQKDKTYVDGSIRITTTEGEHYDDDIYVRLTGDGSLHKSPIKNFYFKVKKGKEDFFDEWDRFSIKKAAGDTTGIAEKFASDLALSMGIYSVMQRMRKQWIKRTYGEDEKGHRGTHYKGHNGNMKEVLAGKVSMKRCWDVEYANIDQNDNKTDPVTGELDAYTDMDKFIKKLDVLHKKLALTEQDKEDLRNLIDYDVFARAVALDFYSGHEDGYFFTQHSNHEWYHDAVTGKWKLLRWDLDTGLRNDVFPIEQFYIIAPKSKGAVLPLEVLLKDEQYVNLYQTVLTAVAQKVFPPADDYTLKDRDDRKPISLAPKWAQRFATFHEFILYNDVVQIPDPNPYTDAKEWPLYKYPNGEFKYKNDLPGKTLGYAFPHDKGMWNRTMKDSEPRDIILQQYKETGFVKMISLRSKQILQEKKDKNWVVDISSVERDPLPNIPDGNTGTTPGNGTGTGGNGTGGNGTGAGTGGTGGTKPTGGAASSIVMGLGISVLSV